MNDDERTMRREALEECERMHRSREQEKSMAGKKKDTNPTEIDILRINQGRLTCFVRGTTPLIYNAMSAKIKQGLLYPKKKTSAEKQSTAKHYPLHEFRDSLYTSPSGPTLLSFPAVAFKRALASSALDLGGAKRAQIERLVWAIGERIPVWGVPMLRMDVVRSADMNRTPDVRTRAIVAEWACKIELAYVEPTVNETMVANLLAAAGLIRGIGDFRQEKGAGNYGQFILVDADDKDWARIVKEGGRAAQQKAVEKPLAYDQESEALLAWWHEEFSRRGHDKTAKPSNGQQVTQ